MRKVDKSQILLLALIVAVFPYLYLCFFANPSSDDFSLAAQAQQYDFFELIYHKYQVRNGRYISSALTYLNPIVFNRFFVYKIISLLFIIAVFLSQLFFVKQFFGKRSKLFTYNLSLMLLLLFLYNMPIISEGFYWFTGGVIYTLGTAIFLFYLGFLAKALTSKINFISLNILTFLLFLSSGFNEVLTLLIVFSLGTLSFILFKNNLESRKLVFGQFIFACIFAAVLVFSPGNGIRGNSYPDAHQFFYSLSYSVIQVGRFSLIWIISIPLIIASVLYSSFNKWISFEIFLFKKSFYLNRWVSLVLLFALIFICVFPAYWATGMLGQHRTLNVAYFFFLIFWFINLTVWFNYYKINVELKNKHKTYMVIVLLVGMYFTGNGYNALNAIFSGSASSFNIQHKERFKKLSKAKTGNQKQLVLKPIDAKPKCLFTSDITSDPKDWRNQAYNMYFRLDSVKIYLEK